MAGDLLTDSMCDDLEELSFSEWPDPPSSHPWLPAYGYQPQQEHQLEKEDFLDPADAALFLGSGCGVVSGVGVTGGFLETIVEETSEELRSEDGSSLQGWMADSDTDSVIHVPTIKVDDCDSGSERDFLCPAKRRRPNQQRPECPPSPSDSTSYLSLSRSSSLAQFESLEQSCQLLEASGPPSPLSILSLDSLDRLRVPEIYTDSLENSSDSERNSSSSQDSAYRIKPQTTEVDHFKDRSLPEERFADHTYIIDKKDETADEINGYFVCNGETGYWNGATDSANRESSSSEFSDARSSDSDRTLHEETVIPAEVPALKYNFKSCRSLDALSSFENLDAAKIDNAYSVPSVRRQALRQVSAQYSAENLSEDSGYSDHFCNFLRLKSKSIPNVSEDKTNRGQSKDSLKRKSEDNLPSIFNAKCIKRSEMDTHFGASGTFHKKATSPDVACGTDVAAASRAGEGTRTKINVARPARPSPSLPDLRSRPALAEFDKYFDPKRARNTFPRSFADKLARLLDEELVFDASDANLYSVSSVPKDLNLCDGPAAFDDNWSFGSERVASSVAAKNFDLGDLNYPSRSQKAAHEVSFKQSFRVCESFTTSVADLTVLDYRGDCDPASKNVLKKFTSSRCSEKSVKMSRSLPSTREMSVESDSTTESEKAFLYEMEKTMKELSHRSKTVLEKSLDNSNFDRNISILTNKRLNCALNPFDEVIAELEKKQERSRAITEKNIKEPSPPLPPPEYEFNFYGEETDPPYYRRTYEASNSTPENSSPDISETFDENMFFHSTPMKATNKVQSTPNLNVYKDTVDMYGSVSPSEELRSSMQHVPLKTEPKPQGILGSKSQGLSGSGGSKGVHFCPIVAEVSWRERSYSEDSNIELSSTTSSYSSGHDPPPPPSPTPHRPAIHTVTPSAAEWRTISVGEALKHNNTQTVTRAASAADRACAPHTAAMEASIAPQPPPVKPSRSRIGGFLSRFANFRFSSRKHKKPAPAEPNNASSATRAAPPAPVHQQNAGVKGDEIATGGNVGTDANNFVYIPLKPASGRPPLPPGRAPRSPSTPTEPPKPAESPGPGLLETDLDTETTRRVLLVGGARARSLLQIPPPTPVARSHKSMEYLLDKDNLICVEPPENELQKNSADRVLSEHQLRVQRSLQKLNVPDWFKNSALPREGFLLKKRASDGGGGSAGGWAGLGGKTTSLGSLGGQQQQQQHSTLASAAQPKSPLALAPHSTYAFTRWSTSRLNSAQTSPCSSARSSVRGGTSGSGPPTPPSPHSLSSHTRPLRPARPPYLGWRSQERLASPRTPHERLAVSLLPASPPVSAEIQSSIKEVTSAIVHYVTQQDQQPPSSVSPHNSPRLCWLESSFVGTKPLESPQTPVVVQPGPVNQFPPRPLQLDLPTSNDVAGSHPHHKTVSTTTYQHEWQSPQKSLLNVGISRPSPGSTTLEDVLDSLLGLPSAAPRALSPQTSPRSPYTFLGLQNRYHERSGSQCSSLQLSLSSRTEDYRTASRISVSGEDSLDSADTLHPSQTDSLLHNHQTDTSIHHRHADNHHTDSLTYGHHRAESKQPESSTSHHTEDSVNYIRHTDNNQTDSLAYLRHTDNNQSDSLAYLRHSDNYHTDSSTYLHHTDNHRTDSSTYLQNTDNQHTDGSAYNRHSDIVHSDNSTYNPHADNQHTDNSAYHRNTDNHRTDSLTYRNTDNHHTDDSTYHRNTDNHHIDSSTYLRNTDNHHTDGSTYLRNTDNHHANGSTYLRNTDNYLTDGSTYRHVDNQPADSQTYHHRASSHRTDSPYQNQADSNYYRPPSGAAQRIMDEECSTPGRRRSSSGSATLPAADTDGADNDDNSSITSLSKGRSRAKSVVTKRSSSRRQSEPTTGHKSVSLDRRVSLDPHLAKADLNLSRTSLSDLQQSKTSLKSITSINTDASGEEILVHCRYTKCTSATSRGEARRHYKNCHNCNYVYCSRECRRAHWEKHRKVCLHSRASALCKQILSAAKEDSDSWHHISVIAQKGYLTHGRGVVKSFFTSPEAAEKFTTNGFQSLGEPVYVKWPDLMPNEMGPELYAELVKLCKSYNPETRLVLYVAVCIISEVPTKGAVVKWERQLVSRCAKMRLSKTVTGLAPHGQLPFHLSPKAKAKGKNDSPKNKSKERRYEIMETLILTSNSADIQNRGSLSVQKIREISFENIQSQLNRRGVNLKRHFPEVHSKLMAYVEGSCDKFAPMTVYPRDILTGKSFMCVIMPETEPDKYHMLPIDGIKCRTVDVSQTDSVDQVSTPM